MSSRSRALVAAASVVVAALLIVACLSIGLGGRTVASAAVNGLAFPAPPGTEWIIISGYNTATHIDGDPYAIDVVREDGGETAGTPLLAPVAGRARISSDCLTVRPEDGVAVLLCHVTPVPTLKNNDWVQRGETIGHVAQPGEAGNGGYPHIHIAVHASGDRSFGVTVPLEGGFAIEGQQLRATTEPNAYSGVAFLSSNHLILSTPPPTATPKSKATATPASAPRKAGAPASEATLAGFSSSGASLSVVVEATSTDRVLEAMREAGANTGGCTLGTIASGKWVLYIVGAPAAVNDRWQSTYGSAIPGRTPLYTRCA